MGSFYGGADTNLSMGRFVDVVSVSQSIGYVSYLGLHARLHDDLCLG